MVQYSVPKEHNAWVLTSVVLLVVNVCLCHSLTTHFERQQFTTVAQHSHADTGIRRLNGLDNGTGSLNPPYGISANFCVVLCGSMRKGSQSRTKHLWTYDFSKYINAEGDICAWEGRSTRGMEKSAQWEAVGLSRKIDNALTEGHKDGRGTRKKQHRGLRWLQLKERHHFEELVVDGRIIIKRILKEMDRNARTGLICFTIRASEGCCEHGNEPSGFKNNGHFVTGYGNISLRRRNLFHGVGCLVLPVDGWLVGYSVSQSVSQAGSYFVILTNYRPQSKLFRATAMSKFSKQETKKKLKLLKVT